jgi:hypothetical protein
MAKYRVILMGIADSREEGVRAFMGKFAAAYKMTPEQAETWIQKTKSVIYTCDDLTAAEKGKDYLTRLGGIAAIKEAADQPPSPPPDLLNSKPGLTPVEGPCSDVPDFDDGPADSEEPLELANSSPQVGSSYINANPEKQMHSRPCPKCFRPVSMDQDQCPYCQVYISKYEQMLARRADGLVQAPAREIATASDGDPGLYNPAVMNRGVSRYDAVGAAVADGTIVKCSEASMSLLFSLVGLSCLGMLGPVAVYYGFKALGMINRDPRFTGKGQALAGTIIGILETIVFLTMIAGFFIGAQRGLINAIHK